MSDDSTEPMMWSVWKSCVTCTHHTTFEPGPEHFHTSRTGRTSCVAGTRQRCSTQNQSASGGWSDQLNAQEERGEVRDEGGGAINGH